LLAQASRFDLLERLAELPGGRELLAAADERTHLVGGSVRDLLRGAPPRELDVVREGPIEELLDRLEGRSRSHGRFETATVEIGKARIDIARSRSERYPYPGALPEVAPAPLASDLRRRDFTVNAIALALAGPGAGTLLAVEDALADLAARRMRVLHEQSFHDDPTRLLRLARYRARLRFALEPDTGELAAAAVRAGALRSVSCARIARELRLSLSEEDPIAQIQSLEQLRILAALDLGPSPPSEQLRRALSLLPHDGSAALLLAGALLAGKEALPERLRQAGLSAQELRPVLASAGAGGGLAQELARPRSASALHALLAHKPPEAIALAGALGGKNAEQSARRYLEQLRAVALRIDGSDLLAAGIDAGPAIGRGLRAALAARLDGEIPADRQEELRRALEGARAVDQSAAEDRS
jgi:tRNA nucleotidyltransferase (CCA-adding enzyme)